MGIKFFDYDNDGRMDLFITDMHSDMFEERWTGAARSRKPEAAWTDSYLHGRELATSSSATPSTTTWATARFEEVSDRMGVENYWPWGVSVGDINADGWDDIFIASGMSFPYRYGINSMLLNNRGAEISRFRIYPRHRAAPGRPYPHAMVRNRLLRRMTRSQE